MLTGNSFRAGALWALIFMVLALPLSTKGYAQDPHALVRKSLAYIKVTALVASGPLAGNPVEATGTGFLISADGLVLTNYHLLSELGDVVPKTVQIQIAIREKTAQFRPAAIIDGANLLDLLLLKMTPAPDPYIPLSLGSAYELPPNSEIFTSGFPNSLSYRKQTGMVEAREGAGGYLWSVTMAFQSGQSGSPVYDASGKVIGVVKGDQDGLNFIIPIDFADGLIAQVRLQELRARVSQLERDISGLSGLRVVTRRISDDSPGNTKSVSCQSNEVITSCIAYMSPSGASLCGVGVTNGGRTCSTSGCNMPAGQRYILAADCARLTK